MRPVEFVFWALAKTSPRYLLNLYAAGRFRLRESAVETRQQNATLQYIRSYVPTYIIHVWPAVRNSQKTLIVSSLTTDSTLSHPPRHPDTPVISECLRQSSRFDSRHVLRVTSYPRLIHIIRLLGMIIIFARKKERRNQSTGVGR
jgi:hypothetical protein